MKIVNASGSAINFLQCYERLNAVMALQWTGKNVDEMRRFTDGHIKADDIQFEKIIMVWNTRTNVFNICNLNDYIVYRKDSGFFVFNPKQFTKKFENITGKQL
jgi:hypothetical protein